MAEVASVANLPVLLPLEGSLLVDSLEGVSPVKEGRPLLWSWQLLLLWHSLLHCKVPRLVFQHICDFFWKVVFLSELLEQSKSSSPKMVATLGERPESLPYFVEDDFNFWSQPSLKVTDKCLHLIYQPIAPQQQQQHPSSAMNEVVALHNCCKSSLDKTMMAALVLWMVMKHLQWVTVPSESLWWHFPRPRSSVPDLIATSCHHFSLIISNSIG